MDWQQQRKRRKRLKAQNPGQPFDCVGADEKLLFQYGLDAQTGIGAGVHRHGHRKAVHRHLPDEVAAGRFDELQLYERVLFAKPLQQWNGQDSRRAGRQTYGNPPRGCIAPGSDGRLGIVKLPQDGPGVAIQQLPHRGRSRAVNTALEQSNAKFSFQVGHVLAQRGLRDEQRIGRRSDVSQLDDFGEVAQVTNIYISELSENAAQWLVGPWGCRCRHCHRCLPSG